MIEKLKSEQVSGKNSPKNKFKKTRNQQVINVEADQRFADDRNFLNSSRYMDEVEASQSVMQSRMEPDAQDDEESDSDEAFYEAFAKNVTDNNMIQSTIYHLRHEG